MPSIFMAVGDSGACSSWGLSAPVVSSVASFRSSSVSAISFSGGFLSLLGC